MELQKKSVAQKWKWLSTSGWTAFTVLTWELLEELFENFIAYGLTALTSAMLLILATQSIKLGIKKLIRLLFPFIKQLTYKEGNDKMNMLKNYWTKVWGNKITGGMAGIGFAGISYFQTVLPFATANWWFALIVFVVFFNVGVFFGGETLKQIQERLAESTLTKEQNAIVKEAQKRYETKLKEASQSETQKIKAEEEAKAKEEREAKISLALAEIEQKEAQKLAEKQNKQ